MRNLLFLYLLFLSASVFAGGGDTLSLDTPSEGLTTSAEANEFITKGQTLFDAGKFDEALMSYQNSLIQLSPGFSNQDPSENPDKKALYANPDLSKIFEGKAKAFEAIAEREKGIETLEKALTSWELMFEVDRHLGHVGIAYDQTHFNNLVANAFSLYEKTNNPSVLLRVFRLVEKCRKIKTLEKLRDPVTKQIANVPAKLIDKLVFQKLHLDKRLKSYLSAKGTANEGEREEAYKSIRKSYQNALFDFKKKYPDFYRLQYDESVVTVGEIQNRISDKEEAVIAFYDTKDQLYIFIIAQNGFRGRRITKDFPMEDWIKQLRVDIQNYGSGDKEAACIAYRKMAYQLYQKIVEPLGALPKSVVLIPDGAVAQLPFSALLSKSVSDCNFKNYPFLLRDHQISYHYGVDLYARAAYLEHETYKSVVGISSGKDMAAIGKVMGGTVLDATNANIEREAATASLLHLSVPTQTNMQKKPWFSLQLSGNRSFSEKEIYDLNVASQMVVLSDCTLGNGTADLLSIVQGFQYAGAQSVITSLWKNDERAVRIIMNNFYTQLRNGMTKDAALQSACLALWKEKDAEICHPLNWATYMPVGDMDAVKEKNWYLYLIGIAPLVALFYFWRRTFRVDTKK